MYPASNWNDTPFHHSLLHIISCQILHQNAIQYKRHRFAMISIPVPDAHDASYPVRWRGYSSKFMKIISGMLMIALDSSHLTFPSLHHHSNILSPSRLELAIAVEFIRVKLSVFGKQILRVIHKDIRGYSVVIWWVADQPPCFWLSWIPLNWLWVVVGSSMLRQLITNVSKDKRKWDQVFCFKINTLSRKIEYIHKDRIYGNQHPDPHPTHTSNHAWCPL